MVVFLSFEKFLEEDSLRVEFNKAPYVKNFKERQNISKNRLDPPVSQSKYLKVGEYFTQRYDEVLGYRNVAALQLTFDLLLSVYDGNSKTIFAYRFMDWPSDMEMRLEKDLRALRAPSLELRIIGMQNGQGWKSISDIVPFIKKRGIGVFEIDLFGKEIRHVSVDMKTGTSMDILVNNRLYKPGELVNSTTLEQFEREARAARA
jgi:hypothetical protein